MAVALVIATVSCTTGRDRGISTAASMTPTSGLPDGTGSEDIENTTDPSPDGIRVVQLDLIDRPIDVPERFFGFNAASIVSPVNVERMLDPQLWKELRQFPVPLIRVPSGTAAQWIDWRTGRFVDAPGSPFADVATGRRGITMEDWAALIDATGAEPVWDLNVLNSSLADQIEMLGEAQRLGMPVRFIELGNELWDVRGPYIDRFPTGTAYGEEMNRWIPTIREHFPQARIAISGADRADATFMRILGDRYAEWNAGVLSVIRDIDAIVVHQYWGLSGDAAPGSDVDQTLTAGLDHWSAMRRLTLDQLTFGRTTTDRTTADTTATDRTALGSHGPDDIEVWITEWNQAAHFAPPGPQIWAQALSVVAVGMEHALDPRVTMSLVHNIVDGTGNPHDIGPSTVYPSFTNGENGTDRFGRTALGTALPLLFAAADGNTAAQRLAAVARRGTSAIDGSTLHGIVFSGRRTDVVIVNTGATPTTVRLPRSVSDALGRGATMIEYHAAPDTPLGWEPSTRFANNIIRLDDPGDQHTLPAHSISRITSTGD